MLKRTSARNDLFRQCQSACMRPCVLCARCWYNLRPARCCMHKRMYMPSPSPWLGLTCKLAAPDIKLDCASVNFTGWNNPVSSMRIHPWLCHKMLSTMVLCKKCKTTGAYDCLRLMNVRICRSHQCTFGMAGHFADSYMTSWYGAVHAYAWRFRLSNQTIGWTGQQLVAVVELLQSCLGGAKTN